MIQDSLNTNKIYIYIYNYKIMLLSRSSGNAPHCIHSNSIDECWFCLKLKVSWIFAFFLRKKVIVLLS